MRAEAEGAEMIRLYRRENLAARNGAAAPAYFAEAPPPAVNPNHPLDLAGDLKLAADGAVNAARAGAAACLSALVSELEASAAGLDRAP
jgi:hypothetical protein